MKNYPTNYRQQGNNNKVWKKLCEGNVTDEDYLRLATAVLGDPRKKSKIIFSPSGLKKAVGTLCQDEIIVLRYRYGLSGDEPHTIVDTAEWFNKSPSYIQTIIKKAIRKLKHPNRYKLYVQK